MKTSRLKLRQWRGADHQPFAELCADPRVMRYFPAPLNEEQARASIERFTAHIVEWGYGFWAVERRDNQQFIGFVGLNNIDGGFSFAPGVEIGWRLTKSAWGQGLATEAARAALQFGFEQARLPAIIAMTSVHNSASERVMVRLGMQKIGNFNHPRLMPEHQLCEHVLYRLTAPNGLLGAGLH